MRLIRGVPHGENKSWMKFHKTRTATKDEVMPQMRFDRHQASQMVQ
jgi:hypothetical protein